MPDFDLVADFSALFPVEIISRMVGVPAGEHAILRLTQFHEFPHQLASLPLPFLAAAGAMLIGRP